MRPAGPVEDNRLKLLDRYDPFLIDRHWRRRPTMAICVRAMDFANPSFPHNSPTTNIYLHLHKLKTVVGVRKEKSREQKKWIVRSQNNKISNWDVILKIDLARETNVNKRERSCVRRPIAQHEKIWNYRTLRLLWERLLWHLGSLRAVERVLELGRGSNSWWRNLPECNNDKRVSVSGWSFEELDYCSSSRRANIKCWLFTVCMLSGWLRKK